MIGICPSKSLGDWACRMLFSTRGMGLALVLTHFTDTAPWLAPVAAQEPVSGSKSSMVPREPFTLRRITSEDGLPNNRVQSMLQTADGYLWVGTAFGLARFDGVVFKVFDYGSGDFTKDSITALAVDSKGVLWVGTPDGLYQRVQQRFHRIGREQGLGNAEVRCLQALASGGVLVGASDGLYRVNGVVESVVPSVDVHRLQRLPGGQVLVQLADRWLEFHEASRKLIAPREEFSPGNRPAVILPLDEKGRRWAATPEGIFLKDKSSWRNLWVAPVDRRVSFDQIAVDSDGQPWFLGSSLGVLRLSGENDIVPAFTESAGIKKASVFFVDHEKTRWLGTADGLVQLHPRLAMSYTEAELSSGECRSLFEAPDGTVWIATAAGLDSIKQGVVQPSRGGLAAQSGSIYSVSVDAGGVVWFGKDGAGLMRLNPTDQAAAAVHLPYSTPKIRVLYHDFENQLWVGMDEGLVCLKDGVVQTFKGFEAFEGRRIRAVYRERSGTLWVGTDGFGICRLVGGDAKWYEGLTITDNRVLTIQGDSKEGIWVGTKRGLTYFNNGNFSLFTARNALPESVVNQVFERGDGYIWLSGLKGVHRLHRETLLSIALDKEVPIPCVTLNRADGMESSETSGGQQPAGSFTRDGRIWVPTGRGATAIDSARVQERVQLPKVVLEEVKAGAKLSRLFVDGYYDGQVLGAVGSQGKVVDVPSNQRDSLQIQYTANTFIQPSKVRFRYRLSELQKEWSEPMDRRVAVFTRLRPRHYTFEVQAMNLQGEVSPEIATFSFRVYPKLNESWWFGATVCALGTVGVASLLRVRWQRQRESIRAEVTSLERERTRIARDLHDDVGANMTGLGLKAQLAALEFPGEASAKLQELARDIRSLVDRMREVIWAVNPECDTLENLVNYLTHSVEGFLTAAGCRCRLDVPAALPRLPVCAEARHNLLSVTKEALNNAVRHAEASEVFVRIAVDPARLQLQIKDDGCGFDPDDTEIVRINGSGHGMGNMRKRIEDLRGVFTVRSSPGEGTEIVAELQLSDLAKVKIKSNGHNDTAASQRTSNQPQSKYDRNSATTQHR